MNRQKARGSLDPDTAREIALALNAILADFFALYIKTKNFQWHMSGPHFREYTLLLREQAVELLARSELIAERVRQVGGSTIRSIGQIARHQRILDNDAEHVTPPAMLVELHRDNEALAMRLRTAHHMCNVHQDVATTGVIEGCIHESERRMWVLFESGRK